MAGRQNPVAGGERTGYLETLRQAPHPRRRNLDDAHWE